MTHPNRKASISPLRTLLFGLLLVLLHACHDDGGVQTAHTEISVHAEQFLALPANVPAQVTMIAETIRRQDAEYHFIDALVKNEGYAVWQKAIVTPLPADPSSGTVVVPLLPEDGKQVKSALMCRVSGAAVSITLFRSGQYKEYEYSGALDRPSAESIASFFMVLNHKVLGVSKFKLTDDRLFYDPKQKGQQYITLRPKEGDPAGRTAIIISFMVKECYDVVHDGNEGEVVGVEPGGSSDYPYSEGVVCDSTLVVIDIPDSNTTGSGNDPGGNSGGNPGSSPDPNSPGGGTRPGNYGPGWGHSVNCGEEPPPGSPPIPCPNEPGFEPVPWTYNLKWYGNYPIIDDFVLQVNYGVNDDFWEQAAAFTRAPGTGPFGTPELRNIGTMRNWHQGLTDVQFNRKVGKAFESTALTFYGYSENRRNYSAPRRAQKNAPAPPKAVRPDAMDGYQIFWNDEQGGAHISALQGIFGIEVKAVKGTLELNSNDWQILGELEVLRQNFDDQISQPYWQAIKPSININSFRNGPVLFFITTDDTEIGQSIINEAANLGISIWQAKAVVDHSTSKISFGEIKFVFDKSGRASKGDGVPRDMFGVALRGAAGIEVPMYMLGPGSTDDDPNGDFEELVP